MMRFLKLCLALFLLFNVNAYAQTDQSESEQGNYKSTVLIVPQYATISGIRIDYERKLKEDKWLILAPQLYVDNNGYNSFDQVNGFGMNMYYKTFLSHSKRKNYNGLSRTNLYFAIGPTLQHINLVRDEEVPVEFTDNDITYIRFRSKDVTTVINKIGGSANFGLQFVFDRFILDLYAGIGIRYALDSDGKMTDTSNEYWTDFGYSGILMNGGVKFGFFIQ
jgi:hypothetical protein